MRLICFSGLNPRHGHQFVTTFSLFRPEIVFLDTTLLVLVIPTVREIYMVFNLSSEITTEFRLGQMVFVKLRRMARDGGQSRPVVAAPRDELTLTASYNGRSAGRSSFTQAQ